MPTVVLKLFAGQGNVADGWTDKAATKCFPFGKHKKHCKHTKYIWGKKSVYHLAAPE